MKKLISIILSILMAFTILPASTVSAFAYYNDCQCCDECTGDDDCDCGCDDCEYCEYEEWDGEDDYEDGEEWDGEDGEDGEEWDGEDGEDGENEETDYGENDKYSYDITVEGENPAESVTPYTADEKAQDDNNWYSYQTCGQQLLWYIRNDTLYIFGKGKMTDYDSTSSAPWANRDYSSVVFRTGVTSIGKNAFAYTDITHVTIPSSVKIIGDYAFMNCQKLKAVEFGKDMREIGVCAFYNCKALKKLVINNGLTDIECSAFENCSSLVKVRFSEKMDTIEENSFKGCTALNKVILRTGLVNIKTSAFENCTELSTVNFPNTITTIGSNAFKNCKALAKAVFPDSLVTVGESAFEGCLRIPKIVLYENVREIGRAAFKNTGITAATFHSGLSVFDENMFEGCSSVEIKVKANENVYKTLVKKSNLEVLCIEHTLKNLNPTKATFNVAGIASGQYCTSCGEKVNVKEIAGIHSISLSKTNLTYNGKTQIPSVTVKDMNGKTILPKNNYKLTPAAGCCAVGTYSIKVDFTGNYYGSKTCFFTIVPKAASVSKVKGQSKAVAITLKKQTVQTTGYEIQYSASSNFSGAKTITLKNTQGSYTLKNLAAKKKYYFRVRSYKQIGSNKIYSSWSKTKKATTKK